MVSWTLVFTRQAKRDAKKLAGSGLKPRVFPVEEWGICA